MPLGITVFHCPTVQEDIVPSHWPTKHPKEPFSSKAIPSSDAPTSHVGPLMAHLCSCHAYPNKHLSTSLHTPVVPGLSPSLSPLYKTTTTSHVKLRSHYHKHLHLLPLFLPSPIPNSNTKESIQLSYLHKKK